MNNASSLEIVWTVLSIIGQGYTLFNMRDAWGDWRIIRIRRVNGARRRIAIRNVRKEIARLILFSVTLIIGVYAMNTPAPVRQSVSYLGHLISYGFMTVIFITMINAVLDRSTRREIINTLRRVRDE